MPELEPLEPESGSDQPPPAPPAAAVATVPVAAPPPPPSPPEEPEADAIDVQGQRYVPLAAVHQARKNLREAKDQIHKFQAAATELAPYLTYLQQHPEVMTGEAPSVADEPPVDDGAAELARTLDLYTREGQPDVERARKLDGLIIQRAQAIADRTVKPMRQETATEKSVRNYQRALETPAPNGLKVNPDTLRQIWVNMPVEYTADERVAATLAYFALGYEQVHGHAPVPPPTTAPLVTEPLGSRHTRPQGMSTLEKNIASLRGVKNDDWEKLTDGWQPGRPSILEE